MPERWVLVMKIFSPKLLSPASPFTIQFLAVIGKGNGGFHLGRIGSGTRLGQAKGSHKVPFGDLGRDSACWALVPFNSSGAEPMVFWALRLAARVPG